MEAETANAQGTRPKILVVEDDSDLLYMLKTMLASVGEVWMARDGQEALDVLAGGATPDVIVTDLMMPRVDGLTLAQALRDDERLAGVPLIMLSAKGAPQDMASGLSAGARHYVTKPFKAAELIDKVRRSIGRR